MIDRSAPRTLGSRLRREPMVHFFVLGAILFAAHELREGDPYQIVVTRGLKADLDRRLTDKYGRPPSSSERADALAAWKRDEALYREALRRKIDHNDAVVRGVLIDKMRAEAALRVAPPEPSDTDLVQFLQAHEERYEISRRYDFQFLHFSKAEAGFEEEVARAAAALEAGAQPSDLGRPLMGGKLTASDLESRVAAPLRARIAELAPGPWVRVEGEADLWLLRVREITGGLPPLQEVRERVAADFKAEALEKEIERELNKTVDLYQFEETPGAN